MFLKIDLTFSSFHTISFLMLLSEQSSDFKGNTSVADYAWYGDKPWSFGDFFFFFLFIYMKIASEYIHIT